MLFLFITFLTYVYTPDFLFQISFFIPFILGGLGLIFAVLGIKGTTRMILVVLNLFILIVFIFVYIMAFYGFQEP